MQYNPLDPTCKEFGLLTVLPGEDDDDLHCLHWHASLESKPLPCYETISYCWGDGTNQASIYLDGIAIVVPSNTAIALHRARKHDEERICWLDALCVNQKDYEERSRQVLLMGDIYRHGRCKLIILGDHNIDVAITSIKAILAEINANDDNLRRLRNQTGSWQYSDSRISAKYDVEALIDFFSLPWFRRLWVLQEAALAQHNICLSSSPEIDLLDITRVAAWLVFHYYYVDPKLRLQCSYAADMNDLVDKTYGTHSTAVNKPADLMYLLDLAQQRQCTLAADKVYGIIGLTTDKNQQPTLVLNVDYRKSPGEVFRDASWRLIQKSASLQVLDYVRHWCVKGELDLDGCPSWTPKWHRFKDMTEHANFLSLSFDACSGQRAHLSDGQSTDVTPELLRVRGLLIGEINRVTERVHGSDQRQSKALYRMIEEAQRLLCELMFQYHDAVTIATCFVAGVDLNYKPVGREIVQGFHSFSELMQQGYPPPEIADIDATHDVKSVSASHFAEAAWSACMNRVFFTCSSGHFGLAPYFSRPGDIVAILYGLQYPAILRPIHGEYLFLGVAYIQDLMSGEAMSQAHFPQVMFNIR